jgi:molybdopterin-guanine dinucleotide biosynthesis protein A
VTPPAVAGMLLTGGRSSRMGRDKATMPWSGPGTAATALTWAQRSARLLAAVAAPAIEIGPGTSGLPAVHDDRPAGGPLLAVVAGWQELRRLGSGLPALVLACDLPLLSVAVLRRLADWPGGVGGPGGASGPGAAGGAGAAGGPGAVVPVLGGRPQWTCARYSDRCLQAAAELAAAGRRDLCALGEAARDEGGVAWLGPEALGAELASLADADTPEDLAALGLVPGVPALLRRSGSAAAGGPPPGLDTVPA